MTDQEILRLIRHSMAATQELVDLWSKPRAERERAKVAEEQRWIPIGERLPETNGGYLCRVCCGGLRVRYTNVYGWTDSLAALGNCDFTGIDRAGWYDHDFGYGFFEAEDVTHWMPLPEPPKGEEK